MAANSVERFLHLSRANRVKDIESAALLLAIRYTLTPLLAAATFSPRRAREASLNLSVVSTSRRRWMRENMIYEVLLIWWQYIRNPETERLRLGLECNLGHLPMDNSILSEWSGSLMRLRSAGARMCIVQG